MFSRLPLKPFGVSQETFVPTSGDIATKFFGEAETPQQAGGRALGSFLSGSFAPGAISKAGSFIKEGAIGRPSIRGSKVAAEAELARVAAMSAAYNPATGAPTGFVPTTLQVQFGGV
jgi:hypothetical protein